MAWRRWHRTTRSRHSRIEAVQITGRFLRTGSRANGPARRYSEISDKQREDRLRKAPGWQGYALRKDRVRSYNADHLGGFMIVDANRNLVAAGSRFDLELDDVEEFVRG